MESTLVAVAKPTIEKKGVRRVVIIERDDTRVGRCFLHHVVADGLNGPRVVTGLPTHLDLVALAAEAFAAQDAARKPKISVCVPPSSVTAESLAAALLAAVNDH